MMFRCSSPALPSSHLHPPLKMTMQLPGIMYYICGLNLEWIFICDPNFSVNRTYPPVIDFNVCIGFLFSENTKEGFGESREVGTINISKMENN